MEINKNPGTRIICEWCGKLLVNRKRFCCRVCQNTFLARNQSDAQRRKMSDAHKGAKNHFYGKTHTKEARDKISKVHKGKTLSEESKQKLSESIRGENHPMYGKHHTDEAKAKISKANSGEGNPMYGKHHTDETKTRMRESKLELEKSYQYDSEVSQSEYRRKAIEAYGYKCSGCGCTEGILHVHHLDGNHDNDDIENLVVLCRQCHGRIHPHKFRGDSTPDKSMTEFVIANRDRTSG